MPEPDRRNRILAYAAPLFAEKGISGCTVRNIADGVGMLSGSLYHHFDSKDDMVEAIVADYLEELTARYDEVLERVEGGRERLDAVVRTSIEVGLANRHASQIYQANRDYFAHGDRFARVRRLAGQAHRTWVEVIDAGVAEGAFRDDVNPKVFHRFLRDAVFLTSRWYHPSRKYSVRRLAEDTVRIFLDGFTVPERS